VRILDWVLHRRGAKPDLGLESSGSGFRALSSYLTPNMSGMMSWSSDLWNLSFSCEIGIQIVLLGWFPWKAQHMVEFMQAKIIIYI
jgi:hypothetical protein